MTDVLTVGVALSSRPWRGQLQRHCRDHESDLAVVLLQQGADALNGTIDVLVVDDDTSWLSAPFAQSARDAGLGVIGLFDSADAEGYGRRQLQRFGIDTAFDATLDTPELVEAIRRHRRDKTMHRQFENLITDAGLGSVEPIERRAVIAIGGPAGAGATEVCLALASALVPKRPLVIDVDETHPSLARRLGLALHPHLLTAVDVHRREPLLPGDGPTELDECLAKPLRGNDPRPFDVIAGLVTRDDWSLVRPDDVVGLIDACAQRWPAVLVRLGPSLEDLHRYCNRYELSRRSATTADHLVGVCDGSASGLLRFVDWLVDALGLIGDNPIDVVLNRAPRSPAQRDQLIDQLRSVAGDRIRSVVCAPIDKKLERASWEATVPATGPFHRAITGLGIELAAELGVPR